MNVVLTHPIHGAKIAMTEVEIELDEKLGWVRYTEPTPTAEVAAPVKRRYTRRTEQTIEQPNSNMLASDESEGE